MFRLLVICACLAVPVLSNSAGAPQAVCDNGLTPEHGLDGQTSPVPYELQIKKKDSAGNPQVIVLKAKSVGFKGFALQAQDEKQNPFGKFTVIESSKSQTLNCKGGTDNTLTHKLLKEPATSLEFMWTAPPGYKGKATFVATVAQTGALYWIRKVILPVVLV